MKLGLKTKFRKKCNICLKKLFFNYTDMCVGTCMPVQLTYRNQKISYELLDMSARSWTLIVWKNSQVFWPSSKNPGFWVLVTGFGLSPVYRFWAPGFLLGILDLYTTVFRIFNVNACTIQNPLIPHSYFSARISLACI